MQELQAKPTDVIWSVVRRPPDAECRCSRCEKRIHYSTENKLLSHPCEGRGEYRYHSNCLTAPERFAIAESLRVHGEKIALAKNPSWEKTHTADKHNAGIETPLVERPGPAERIETKQPPQGYIDPPILSEPQDFSGKVAEAFSAIADDSPPFSGTQLVERLKQIKPLPKPHYSWPLNDVVFDTPGLLEQVVRITGTASGHLVWTSAGHWERMIAAVKEHDGVLGITYSPFNKRTNELIATAEQERITLEKLQSQKLFMAGNFDPAYYDELDLFKRRLRVMNEWAEVAGVKIGAVVLDHEKSLVNNHTRRAIAQKLTKFYALCHAAITSRAMRVVWFKYGGRSEASQFGGWRTFEQVPFEGPEAVPCDNLFGCTLYNPEEVHHQRAVLYETLAFAKERGVNQIAPWVSLGWRWTRDNVSPNRRRADESPYTTTVSWILGHLLNRPRRDGIARHVPLVVFWPEVGNSPAFWDHFMAYCRGAQNER